MLPSEVPKNYLIKVANSLFDLSNEDGDIDFVIVLDNTNISFRDFSAYLLAIDHFYGRTYRKGFLSYSLTEDAHLRAMEIRQGSLEIIIEEILKHISVQNAVYLYLLIKFLPAALKTISEASLNFSETYHNYEKSRLVRLVRKNLRQSMKDDEVLKDLSDTEIVKLAEKLQKKYDLDKKLLLKASKFSREKLKSVQIRRRNK